MPGPELSLAGRRLFIFDLDGTLADTSAAHALAFETALAPRGIAVDYASVAGLATEAAMEQLLAGAGQSADGHEMRALVAAKRAAARDNLAHVREVEGASAFLDRAAPGHRLALCTSAARETAETTLTGLGFSQRFDFVVTADEVSEAKPSPEGFQRVLALAQVSPADAIVFEDSDAGLASAAAAGIDAIRIGTGGASWAQLARLLDGVHA